MSPESKYATFEQMAASGHSRSLSKVHMDIPGDTSHHDVLRLERGKLPSIPVIIIAQCRLLNLRILGVLARNTVTVKRLHNLLYLWSIRAGTGVSLLTS